MPSFEQAITNNRIIVIVDVCRAAGEQGFSFKALLDTGATITGISPKVVEALQLAPLGTISLSVASGDTIETARYHARVDIPIGVAVASQPDEQRQERFLMGRDLFVSGLPYQPEEYDVILGMDFIGAFHITIYRNRIILSN